MSTFAGSHAYANESGQSGERMMTFVGFGFAALSASVPRDPQVVVPRLKYPSPVGTTALVFGDLINLLVRDVLRGLSYNNGVQRLNCLLGDNFLSQGGLNVRISELVSLARLC